MGQLVLGRFEPPPLTVEELLDRLRPGKEWRNVHTGSLTVITDFAAGPESGGSVRIPSSCLVHHTSNVPPGFKRGGGQTLKSFVEHWRPTGASE